VFRAFRPETTPLPSVAGQLCEPGPPADAPLPVASVVPVASVACLPVRAAEAFPLLPVASVVPLPKPPCSYLWSSACLGGRRLSQSADPPCPPVRAPSPRRRASPTTCRPDRSGGTSTGPTDLHTHHPTRPPRSPSPCFGTSVPKRLRRSPQPALVFRAFRPETAPRTLDPPPPHHYNTLTHHPPELPPLPPTTLNPGQREPHDRRPAAA